jgi:hypothetical protein
MLSFITICLSVLPEKRQEMLGFLAVLVCPGKLGGAINDDSGSRECFVWESAFKECDAKGAQKAGKEVLR